MSRSGLGCWNLRSKLTAGMLPRRWRFGLHRLIRVPGIILRFLRFFAALPFGGTKLAGAPDLGMNRFQRKR